MTHTAILSYLVPDGIKDKDHLQMWFLSVLMANGFAKMFGHNNPDDFYFLGRALSPIMILYKSLNLEIEMTTLPWSPQGMLAE